MPTAAHTESPRTLEWVKPAHQTRTREALTRILDAAEALVAEKGFNEATVNQITRLAKSSVGGFYRRFADKQGLLQAIHERFCEEARATTDAALDPVRWVDTPTALVIDEFVAFLVRIHRDREGAFRAFVNSGAEDEIVRRRTRELIAYLSDRLYALLRERRADIGHPDLELACPVALNLVLGTLIHAIQLQPDSLGLGDPRLPGELARAFLAYLGVRAAPL